MSKQQKYSIQYPSKVVSMQSQDRVRFLERNYQLTDLRHSTHWNIKVAAPQKADGFKVFVFASSMEGYTQGYDLPIFETVKTYPLDDAMKLIGFYTDLANEDKLYEEPSLKQNKLLLNSLRRKRILLLRVPKKRLRTQTTEE